MSDDRLTTLRALERLTGGANALMDAAEDIGGDVADALRERAAGLAAAARVLWQEHK